jgi:hypothetical protein
MHIKNDDTRLVAGLSISNFYEDLKINQRATEQKI